MSTPHQALDGALGLQEGRSRVLYKQVPTVPEEAQFPPSSGRIKQAPVESTGRILRAPSRDAAAADGNDKILIISYTRWRAVQG